VIAVTGSLKGLKDVLTGVFTLDRDKIAQGLAEVALAMKTGWTTATSAAVTAAKDGNRELAKENDSARADAMAKNRAAILEQQRIDAERKALQFQSLQAHNKAMLLEYQNASSELVALKNKEGDLLKTIADATGVKELGAVRAAAQTRLAEVRRLETEAFREEDQRRSAERSLQVLETNNGAATLIALRKKQIEDLKNLQDAGFKGDRALVRQHLADTQVLYRAAELEETQRVTRFQQLEQKNSATFHRLSLGQQKTFEEQKRRQLMDSLNTQADAQANAYQEMLDRQIKANNDFLANQLKFGTAYAEINRFMHSEIVEGTSKGLDQVAQLTQSHNAVLKAAGQVAASAQIVIKTAQAAMDVYAGFSTIPIIGQALGIAAAAAVIAYGAEQEAAVWAAATGGVMAGGVPGRDSIHTLTMPGEFITPTANFEEVIGSVAAQRAAQKMGAPMGGSAGGPLDVRISFHGQASRMLTAQINQDKALGRHRGRA
jgi:hypothetical protein